MSDVTTPEVKERLNKNPDKLEELTVIPDFNYTLLKHFKKLRKLHVGELLIDLSPLKDLKELEELFLQECKISDVSPLQNLRNLRELNLTGQMFLPSRVIVRGFVISSQKKQDTKTLKNF